MLKAKLTHMRRTMAEDVLLSYEEAISAVNALMGDNKRVSRELRAAAISKLEAILREGLRPGWIRKAVMDAMSDGIFEEACKAVGIDDPESVPLRHLWALIVSDLLRVARRVERFFLLSLKVRPTT